MPAENRDVKVTLDVTAPGGGYKFLDDLNRGLSKSAAFAKDLKENLDKATANREARDARRGPFYGFDARVPPAPGGKDGGVKPSDLAILRNLGLGGIAGRIGTVQGYGKGLTEAGFAGAGGALTKYAGPVGAAMHVADKLANTAQTIALAAHDQYSTTGQIGRSLFKQLVPGGERVQGLVDAFSGRAAGMEREGVRTQQAQGEYSRAAQLTSFGTTFGPEQAARVEAARQAASASPIALKFGDRTSATGEREFRERQRLLPIEKEIARTEREAAVATAARAQAGTEVARVAVRENALMRERKQLQRVVNLDNSSGTKRENLLNQLKDVDKAAAEASAEKRRAEEQYAARRNDEAQKKAAAAEQKAAKTQAEGENLAARAETYRGGQERLGGMEIGDIAQATEWVKLANRVGYAQLPAEGKRQVDSIAPQHAAGLRREAGATGLRAEYGATLAAETKGEDYGDVAATQKAAEAKFAESAKSVLKAQSDAAQVAVEAGKRLGDAVVTAINRIADEAIRTIERKVQQGRNQQ